MRIVASVDISGMIDKLKHVEGEVVDKAVVRAINKVAGQAKVQAAREIQAAGYALKVGEIKKAIEISRANRGLLVATVRARGRPIGLIKYGARQVASGVSVSVKNGRKVIRGAFIATMPNGHRGVFERVGDGHKKITRNGRTYRSGLPIEELFGPSIPSAFINKTVRSQLLAFISDKFPTVLAQEVRFLNLKSR